MTPIAPMRAQALKTAKWHEWQKQAILEVAENPVFLEPDTTANWKTWY